MVVVFGERRSPDAGPADSLSCVFPGDAYFLRAVGKEGGAHGLSHPTLLAVGEIRAAVTLDIDHSSFSAMAIAFGTFWCCEILVTRGTEGARPSVRPSVCAMV